MAATKRLNRTVDPTPELMRIRFDTERELANRLKNATTAQRRGLYSEVYDEFHAKFPYLGYLGESNTEQLDAQRPSRYFRLMRKFLKPDSVFLEVGPGRCIFTREVAEHVHKVYAVDVSEPAMLKDGPLPANVTIVVSDGCSVPIPPETIDIAFAANLIEHLHPDDALEQTTNIYDALKPGGIYMCITPSRLTGPHDVSFHVGEPVALGLHLKEYAYSDLISLMKQVGFEDLRAYLDLKGKVIIPLPPRFVTGFESALQLLPKRLQPYAKRPLISRAMLMVRLVGKKPN